jgi:hypothetical protein
LFVYGTLYQTYIFVFAVVGSQNPTQKDHGPWFGMDRVQPVHSFDQKCRYSCILKFAPGFVCCAMLVFAMVCVLLCLRFYVDCGTNSMSKFRDCPPIHQVMVFWSGRFFRRGTMGAPTVHPNVGHGQVFLALSGL